MGWVCLCVFAEEGNVLGLSAAQPDTLAIGTAKAAMANGIHLATETNLLICRHAYSDSQRAVYAVALTFYVATGDVAPPPYSDVFVGFAGVRCAVICPMQRSALRVSK